MQLQQKKNLRKMCFVIEDTILIIYFRNRANRALMLLGFAEAFMLREESAETDIYSFYKSVYSLIRNISIHPCPPYGNVSVSSFNPRRDKGDPTTGEHYLNLNEILSSTTARRLIMCGQNC